MFKRELKVIVNIMKNVYNCLSFLSGGDNAAWQQPKLLITDAIEAF